jgi:serine/threonine-protein kinase
MGTVYEAVREPLGKRVALKVLHPRDGDQSQAHRRFAREAKASAQLRHPNIVNVFDVGEDAGLAFLVMELLERPTLEEWLRARGALSLNEIVDIFLPIASGICAAHDAGVIHRDLKPGNIMLGPPRYGTRHPVVVDFGISKVLNEEDFTTRSEAILGTLPYLAAELARDAKGVSPSSDQYALGVMLYECSTGRRPFRGASPYELLHAIVTTSPPRLSELDSRLPPEFDAVVARAMARDPQDRYPSVKALASAMLSFGTRRAWTIWGGEFIDLGADNPAALMQTNRELDEPRPTQRVSQLGDLGSRRRRYSLPFALGGMTVGLCLGASFEAASHDQQARQRFAEEIRSEVTPPATTAPEPPSSPEPAARVASANAVEPAQLTGQPVASPPPEPSRPHPLAASRAPKNAAAKDVEAASSTTATPPEQAVDPVTVGANQAPILR